MKRWWNDVLVSEEKILKIINKHYINIAEKSSGTNPSSLGDSTNPSLDATKVGQIIDRYRNHLSAIDIKSSVTKIASLIYNMQLLKTWIKSSIS